MDAQSTNMLNSMNPLKPQVSAGQTLLELVRGDVPSLLGRLTSHFNLIKRMKADGIKDAAHAVGSDYLNSVFGWAPIISDIQAAINVFADIDKALFVSDDTRRSRQWTLKQTSSTFTGTTALAHRAPISNDIVLTSQTDWTGTIVRPPNSGQVVTDALPCSVIAAEKVTLKTTARFATGIRPSSANNGWWDRGEDLNRVFGLEITPSLIWELTPWSWLIDWFFNVGSVIENLTTFGLTNTLLNYAYSTVRREASCLIDIDPYRRVSTTGSGVREFSGTNFVTRTDQKIRRVASPFGFGVSLDQLSSGQWAILVALGLARSR